MVRIKHRYLLFNVLYPSSVLPTTKASALQLAYILFSRPSPSHLSPALLSTLIRGEINTLFGDHGLSVTQSSLRVVYFSPTTSTGILRVPRSYSSMVWAALSFVTSVPAARGQGGQGKETPCVIRVVRVSGTIRKSEEELLRHAKRELVRAKTEGWSTGDEEDVLSMFAEKGKQKATALSLGSEEKDIVDLDDDEDEDMDDLSD